MIDSKAINKIYALIYLGVNLIVYYISPNIGNYGGSFSLTYLVPGILNEFFYKEHKSYRFSDVIIYILLSILFYFLINKINNKLIKFIILLIAVLVSLPFLGWV